MCEAGKRLGLALWIAGASTVSLAQTSTPLDFSRQQCKPMDVVGRWRGDARTPTAFERIDFAANRAFRIYLRGKVSTTGTWSVDAHCVLRGRTLSSPQPWVFRFERKGVVFFLREDADLRPARYTAMP